MLRGYEIEAASGFQRVAGVDEVGYGAWAGPVWVAAVIIRVPLPYAILNLVQDSKKMNAETREKVYDFFNTHTEFLELEMAAASSKEIDQTDVLKATHSAMHFVLERLNPDFSLIDGCRPIDNSFRHKTVVKGDQKILEIALASIMAKVTRDRYMCNLAKEYPEFGWEKNKGYGTLQHRKALAMHQPTVHHRLSWPCCHNQTVL